MFKTNNSAIYKPLTKTFLINLFLNFIYLLFIFGWLGLHCCAWAFSSCGEQGLLFVAVHGLLTAVASLLAEQGL